VEKNGIFETKLIRLRLLLLEESSDALARGTERCYGAGDEEMATSSLHLTDGGAAMPQSNDLSRSLVALDQNSTIIIGDDMLLSGRRPAHRWLANLWNRLAGGGKRIRTIAVCDQHGVYPVAAAGIRPQGVSLNIRGARSPRPPMETKA
jgi:hypothetical protein